MAKTIKAWNPGTNKDCFGNGNPSNIDHIWPISKDGSNTKLNRQILSITSNNKKGDKTKGTINGIRFSIIKQTTKDGVVYGKMKIWIKDVEYIVTNE